MTLSRHVADRINKTNQASTKHHKLRRGNVRPTSYKGCIFSLVFSFKELQCMSHNL